MPVHLKCMEHDVAMIPVMKQNKEIKTERKTSERGKGAVWVGRISEGVYLAALSNSHVTGVLHECVTLQLHILYLLWLFLEDQISLHLRSLTLLALWDHR